MTLTMLRAPRSALRASLALVLGPAIAIAQQQSPPAASQNPSPMVEHTRAHARLQPRELAGTRVSFTGPLGRPVELWIADGVRRARDIHLVVHFHGTAWLPQRATAALGKNVVSATLNLGSGSGVYDRAFTDAAVLDSLMRAIDREIAAVRGAQPELRTRITLVGFSAGHGAIRAILREPRHFARIDAVLLLDGMHTSYVPERRVLADSGTIDERNMDVWIRYAQAAMRGEKRFLVTHSEIFPGTFASTTETAEHLLRAVGLRRKPVLKWGPRGMQQLSEARSGRFELLGFAGNSAPDHVDHLHAMPEFLQRLWR